MDQKQQAQINLQIQNYKIQINLKPLVVNLRRGFGTSHSFSQQRQNAQFQCIIQDQNDKQYIGYGECGLPPKKPGCYLSDFNDCLNYFTKIQELYQQNKEKNVIIDCFNNINDNYFKDYRNNQLLNTLFYYIDQPVLNVPGFRAPQSGLEGSVFDAFCKYQQISFVQFANFQIQDKKYSHYTAALQENFKDILESAQFGLQYTQYLKLKFNQDLEFCCETILKQFHQMNLGKFYTVDANASWNPEITLKFLENLEKKQYKKVQIVEQPFPLDFRPGQNIQTDEQWKNVLIQYRKKGILLYADESIATYKDVELFQDYVDGYNFKLDKAGGIRQVLLGIQEARKRNKKVWIGIMVTSDLGTGQAAQVLMEGDEGDMDGGLLVKEEDFKGGFKWGQDGQVELFQDKLGFGVDNISSKNKNN